MNDQSIAENRAAFLRKWNVTDEDVKVFLAIMRVVGVQSAERSARRIFGNEFVDVFKANEDLAD
jgi:hypothetical protein